MDGEDSAMAIVLPQDVAITHLAQGVLYIRLFVPALILLKIHIYLEETSFSKCHELLTSIKEALSPENSTVLQPNLPYITAMLQNAYLSINSVLTPSTTSSDKIIHGDVTKFKQSFGVAPGQKHEKQVSFYRTTQKSGRKRKGNILK